MKTKLYKKPLFSVLVTLGLLFSISSRSHANIYADSSSFTVVDTTTPQIGDTIYFGHWYTIRDSVEGYTFKIPFGRIRLQGGTGYSISCDENGRWIIVPNGGGGGAFSFSSHPNYIQSLSLNTDSLTIGEEICQEKEETEIVDTTGLSAGPGLDAYGFDSLGIHHLTDTTFDLNGFDSAGVHHLTGTEFNPCGCNRDGQTANGDECNPSDCNSSSTYQALADSLRNSILDSVRLVMNQLLNQVEDSLNAIDCGTMRSELNGLVANTGLERELFFGENDKFINTGMSKLFQEKPKLSPQVAGRDAMFKSIESKHIKLYTCDERYMVFSELDTLVSELLQDSAQLNDLREYILTAISYWNEHQFYTLTQDPNKFRSWIILKVGEFLQIDPSAFVSSDLPSIEEDNLIRHGTFNKEPMSRYGMTTLPHINTILLKLIDSLARENNSIQLNNNMLNTAVYKGQASSALVGSPSMPVIIRNSVGNRTYEIIIDNILLYPDKLIFDAYCIIHDIQSDRDLLFSGKNITLTSSGQLSNARLQLGSTVELNLFNSVKLTVLPTSNTYVEWDTAGFKHFGIDGLLEVCRSVLVPLDHQFNVKPEPELVTFEFTISQVSEWLEFSTVLSSQEPFAVADHEKDVAFQLDSLILDFSSSFTPSFKPIEGYTSPFYEGGNNMHDLWKGLYIGNISGTILRDVSQSGQQITLAGEKLLLDGSGFSGKIAALNVLPISTGSMSGWPVSIENIYVKFIKNELKGGGLGGIIGIPVSDDRFNYSANIDCQMNFDFMITPTDTIDIDMWFAKAYIDPNSKIIAEYKGDSLTLTAYLHGELNIRDNVGVGQVNVSFPDLTFKNLVLSTADPHLKIGEWGIKDSTAFEANVAGFTLLIDDITSIDTLGLQGLQFNIEVNLSTKLSITAGGNIALLGKMEQNSTTGLHKWNYDRLALNKLYVDCSFKGMTRITGEIEWFGHLTVPDPVYGRGVRGSVSANFEGINVGVTAVAQFGKVDDYKYFYVDAFANIENLNINIGVFQLTGFGGGMAHHMTMDQSAMMNLGAVSPGDGLGAPGTTISGAILTPNRSTGMAMNANIGFAVANKQIFNGMGSFRMEFAPESLSVQKIAITGVGQFLKDVDFSMQSNNSSPPQPPQVDAPIAAYANIVLDINNKSLHGTLKAYINTPYIKGAGINGKVVDAEFHIDPDKWYIYIGRPEEGQRCGLIVSVLGLDVQATAYFDVGTSVPSMPPLPATVQEIAYKVNTNESLRQSGGGMVFGASLVVKIGVSAGSVVSAEVEAGAGFDLMLKDYGNMSCAGSTEPVGLNGWYAAGQLWAYLQGRLKIFNVPIFEAGLAAVMQARMPNPFWSQATVGVRVRILGARIKKSVKLKLGNDCLLISEDGTDPGVGMEAISFITPMDGRDQVELYSDLEVQFALPLNKKISIPDINDVNLFHEFEVKLSELSLRDSDSIRIGYTAHFSDDSSHVTLEPYDFLPYGDTLTIRVKVDIYKNGELLAEEIKTSTFITTKKRVDIIPTNNVEYAYPTPGMVNFYRANIPELKGYIQLAKGQPDLFQNQEGYSNYVRITRESDGAERYVDLNYNSSEALISFPLDTTFLMKRCSFKLEILEVKSSHFFEINTTENSPLSGFNSNDYSTIPSNNLVHESDTVVDLDRVLYEIDFRVSTYNSFAEKFDVIRSKERIIIPEAFTEQSQARDFNRGPKYIKIDGEDMLDKMELYGTYIHSPLLSITPIIGSDIRANIDTIASEFRWINSDLNNPCTDEVVRFSNVIDDYTQGISINVNKSRSFIIQEINVYETIAQNPFDLPPMEEEEYQAIQGNLVDMQRALKRQAIRAYGCFTNACQYQPDNPTCEGLFYSSNADNMQLHVDRILSMILSDVIASLHYEIGDRSIFSGNISFK